MTYNTRQAILIVCINFSTKKLYDIRLVRREIHVLDRIGGGDGFVGGMLYAILKGWDSEKWIQFGWASGALATTFLTDYAQPADEDQVWSIWQGNARVKR